MQAKIVIRATTVSACSVGVFLALGGMQYVTSAQNGGGSVSGSVAEESGDRSDEGMTMSQQVEVVSVASDELEHVRSGATQDFDAVRRQAVQSATTYTYSPHYLGFVIAHLIDEGVIPERDWELGDRLYELRGKRLTTVLRKTGVKFELLRSEDFDVMALRREFHAGGPLDDPDAGPALLDAIDFLRSCFERVVDDGALIVAF